MWKNENYIHFNVHIYTAKIGWRYIKKLIRMLKDCAIDMFNQNWIATIINNSSRYNLYKEYKVY